MCDAIQDQVYSTDSAELVSVKCSSLTSGYTSSSQVENNAQSSCVVIVEDVHETDRDSTSSSSPKPLPGSLNNPGQIQASNDTTRGVSSLPGNQQSLTGKAGLPGSEPKDKWQGIEHYLREQNKDTDPESLTSHKKHMYQRTWFACVMYGFLLLLLIAAILAIACDRAVIIPNTVLKGQIIPTATPKETVIRNGRAGNDAIVQNLLTSDTTTPKAANNPTMDLWSNGPTPTSVDTTTTQSSAQMSSAKQLPEPVARLLAEQNPAPVVIAATASSDQDLPLPVARLLADAAPKGASSTSSTPIPVTASVPQQGPTLGPQQPVNWWNMLSLPGPLQGSSGSTSVL